MSQEFIKELERLKAKQAEQGGFNAPAPVAPGMQPQAPQELSAPQVGPTLASEVQPDPMASTLDVQAPSIQPETPLFQSTESEQRLVGGVKSASDAVLNAGLAASEAGGNFVNSSSDVVADLLSQSTGGRVNLQSPLTSGVATRDNTGAPITDASQLRAFLSGLNEEAAASEPAATPAPEVPTAAAVTPEVMATPESIADLSVNGTDVVTPEAITEAAPAAPQAQAPQSLNSTQAMLQERFGSPTISGIQSAEEGLGLRTDAQGRMIDPNVDRSSFEQASADREARQAARPDFGEAQARAAGTVTDRERRAARGDGISDADRRDIAKANQRGASASDIARGDKVAALNGIDRRTGEPLEGDGLTFDQQLKLRSQKFNEGKFEYETTKDAKELYDKSLTEAKEAQTAEAKAESVGRGLASSVADMRDVMGRASGRLDGFFSTDMVGKAASFWKGSDADAQEADFAFLKSNVALNAMMELKANSPTGSTGFGALNTEELKVLTNQFATLDPFTDSKLVRQNLKQLNERFEGIIQNAYNTHAAEYGKEAADGVYGSMMGGKQAQGQSNQAPSGKSVTTANGRFTATAVID